ncbi:hypothetical protein Rhe02_15330 [Rhizocola hellebori]|uniref:Alkylmercury lyase n=1 Tax=Rhizocola hellebori TaxID=1392758 RepID=A0A8J3Q4D1_9ACTN|nr:alkylmercury lyase family protein [Rhizocola hellebori]GIH03466.1 hypothetical protein Rhe02_15330 [Rhizocola hellebori]
MDGFDLDIDAVERVGDCASALVPVNGINIMTGAVPDNGASSRLDPPTAHAIGQELSRASADDAYPAQLAVGVTSQRLVRISVAGRAVHRAILRSFASRGCRPDRDGLAAAAGQHDLNTLLAELHDHDVIRLDDRCKIRAAYPFSAVPTAHVVAIRQGPTVYAMCAIDALGMATMLNEDIAISSRDPQTGTPIKIDIRGGQPVWEPSETVVFVGAYQTASAVTESEGGDQPDKACAVAAADRCCGVMNFFASADSADAWQRANRDVRGQILSQRQALRLGDDIFGNLLRT